MKFSATSGSILWLAGFIMVVVFSLKPDFGPRGEYHVDVLLHFATYFFLAYLPFSIPISTWIRTAKIAALAAFGLGSEALQYFMPGRSASISDGAANIAGIGVAILIVWIIANRAQVGGETAEIGGDRQIN
ncbi:MAG: VanZ family protein [Rhodospirillales bacterium]|jgi:VanZ family protein|nr:VanZ family protein [Rhodospirillales bacterium]